MLRIERLVTDGGEPLPEEDWPNVPGARVQVVKELVYPEDCCDESTGDGTDEKDEAYEPADAAPAPATRHGAADEGEREKEAAETRPRSAAA